MEKRQKLYIATKLWRLLPIVKESTPRPVTSEGVDHGEVVAHWLGTMFGRAQDLPGIEAMGIPEEMKGLAKDILANNTLKRTYSSLHVETQNLSA